MRNKNGQALIVATISFIFLVIVLGEAMLLYMRNHHRLNVKQITLTDDFYYAQAGVERAKYKLKVDGSSYSGEENYNIPGTHVSINITVVPIAGTNQFTINSKVLQLKSGGELSAIREIEVVVERTEEVVNEKLTSHVTLLEWKEILPQAQ